MSTTPTCSSKKEDPLHRLSRTPTNAYRQQQWAIWRDAETMRHTPVKHDVLRSRCSPIVKPAAPSSLLAHPSVRTSTKKLSLPSKASSIHTKKSFTEHQLKETAESSSPHYRLPTNAKDQHSLRGLNSSAPTIATVTNTIVDNKDIRILTEAEALELFDEWDENFSLQLSLAELSKGISSTFSHRAKKPAILPAYKAILVGSCGGFVSRHQFFYFWNYLVYYDRLWTAFGNQRHISRDDWALAASDTMALDEESICFDEVDVNGHGSVLFDKLCAHMTRKSMMADDSTQVMTISTRLSTISLTDRDTFDDDLSEILNYSTTSEIDAWKDFY